MRIFQTTKSRMALSFLLTMGVFTVLAADPERIFLWPMGAPGSEGKTSDDVVTVNKQGDNIVTGVHRPSIIPYLASKEANTGAAVIVAPGGGHNSLWSTHEGSNGAQWLAERGVNAFVLRYRLAREKGSTYDIEKHALADALRAIRVIRSRAAEWGINPDAVGIIGFSAGGELAGRAAARYNPTDLNPNDPVDQFSSKPSFSGLIYPGNPGPVELTKEGPPLFLAAGENDREDIKIGLAEFYIKARKAGESAELHMYADVGHGFGVRPERNGPSAGWIARFNDWLVLKGFTKKK